MRLFPISDLHLERRRPETIARPDAPFDVLVCPGDLYEGRPEAGVRCPEDLLDVAQRDVELAEAVDDLGGRNLLDGVVAVTRGLVHHSRFQQGALVVAAQGPHAEVGQA